MRYRKTLDVHKNGTQFLLQGVQTADNLSRVVEVSLMASGDAIDFPLEGVVAFAYVLCPGATEPSYYKCEIVDNKVVCEIPPITVEGITTIQIKLIETSTDNSKSVLAIPEFALEVSKSYATDDGEEMKTTFSGFEEFIMKAEKAYAKRLERIELSSECLFYAYYADGTTYETDILKKLFLNGNVELSRSYAVGGTGVRAGEDADNSKYYSNLSKSEALNAKAIMEGGEELLEEVKLHGLYTAFSVDFETGEVIYASPQYDFKVDETTGNLKVIGKAYSMEDNLVLLVKEWLKGYGVEFPAFKEAVDINTVTLKNLGEVVDSHWDYTNAMESHMGEIEGSLNNTIAMLSGDVVWEDDTQTFSKDESTTISVDLSEYKRFVVTWKNANKYFDAHVSIKGVPYELDDSSNVSAYHRSITITDEGFTVSKLSTTYISPDGDECCPIKLVGYKY